MIQIDKHVPLPPSNGIGRPVKWPLADMEVGDSFIFPLRSRGNIAAKGLRFKPKRFTIRKISETEARIWRVE